MENEINPLHKIKTPPKPTKKFSKFSHLIWHLHQANILHKMENAINPLHKIKTPPTPTKQFSKISHLIWQLHQANIKNVYYCQFRDSMYNISIRNTEKIEKKSGHTSEYLM